MNMVITMLIMATRSSMQILGVIFMGVFAWAAFGYVFWHNHLGYRCIDIDVRSTVAPDRIYDTHGTHDTHAPHRPDWYRT